MKNFIVFSFFLLMVSCGNKEVVSEAVVEENVAIPPYDTIAVDSFSTGAMSVDIARKIKMSSVAYQDSLRDVLKKMEAEKLLQKEKEETHFDGSVSYDKKKDYFSAILWNVLHVEMFYHFLIGFFVIKIS